MREIILGVDPGFMVAGYSVISCTGRGAQLLDLGFLQQKCSDTIPFRVGAFFRFMREKISEYAISMIALETPFLGKNAQTFLKLGYLRGTLYLLSDEMKLKLCEFSPREVKQTVTGFGSASKEQVAHALFLMYPALRSFSCSVRNDVTDALGVGLCGAHMVRKTRILTHAV